MRRIRKCVLRCEGLAGTDACKGCPVPDADGRARCAVCGGALGWVEYLRGAAYEPRGVTVDDLIGEDLVDADGVWVDEGSGRPKRLKLRQRVPGRVRKACSDCGQGYTLPVGDLDKAGARHLDKRDRRREQVAAARRRHYHRQKLGVKEIEAAL